MTTNKIYESVQPTRPWQASMKDRLTTGFVLVFSIFVATLLVKITGLSGKLGFFVSFVLIFLALTTGRQYRRFGNASAKDALVNTDGGLASSKAGVLSLAISTVKMEKLTSEEHTVWMKVVKDLGLDAGRIAETKDPTRQREHFIALSKSMYQLTKVSKQASPVYYQFCPMANDGKGANWLSKENSVKNPYYGSMMLTCGSTIETIK
jgi:hypothetical protein